MSENKLDLVGLLGARICHDLISPVGAIKNGLELLELAGSGPGPEIDLINDSAGGAEAKLRLYRIAFGPDHSDQTVEVSVLSSILQGYYRTSNLSIDLEGSVLLSRPLAKALVLLSMCLETHMSRFGNIHVRVSPNKLQFQATSERTMPKSGLLFQLSQGNWPLDLRAADVHFALAESAFKNASLSISFVPVGNDLNISLTSSEPMAANISPEPSRHQRQGT